MGYQWDFGPVWRNMDGLLLGLMGTLKLTAACLMLAIPLGLLLALMRMSGKRPLAGLALVYIDFFRTAASLVLIFWFFFAFPMLVQLDFDAFTAAFLAIGLQGAAYFAEVFRGGITSIGQGQWEAARAIGMSNATALRYIILPQAVRRMLPVFFTRATLILKTTTLASAIAYSDIVYVAFRVSSDTYRPIETFTVTGLIFFAVIFTLSRCVALLERRLAVAT
jgi:polar amino acid transport system permease protein